MSEANNQQDVVVSGQPSYVRIASHPGAVRADARVQGQSAVTLVSMVDVPKTALENVKYAFKIDGALTISDRMQPDGRYTVFAQVPEGF